MIILKALIGYAILIGLFMAFNKGASGEPKSAISDDIQESGGKVGKERGK